MERLDGQGYYAKAIFVGGADASLMEIKRGFDMKKRSFLLPIVAHRRYAQLPRPWILHVVPETKRLSLNWSVV
jgi:hypothetical protein